MTISSRFTPLLLAAVSLSAIIGAPVQAQEPQIDSELGNEEEEEEIVITGQRERGSVAGDIKPEQQLRQGDIQALGVTNISELLEELGPQLQSASGRRPVTLLEGHRIASFREIASLPSEAISRVDILPEEVGLRFGYSADQRVVNIVLRRRFRAFNGEIDGRIPTAGDGATAEIEGGFLAIRNGQRLNIATEYSSTGRIFESDRGLTDPASPARTLRPMRQELIVNGSYARPLDERTQATLSAELGTAASASNVGLSLPGVLIPGGTPYAGGAAGRTVYPVADGVPLSLERSSSTQNGQIGLSVAAQRSSGQWTLTATYNRQETRTLTARPFDMADYSAAVAAGTVAANPALPVNPAFLISRSSDEARSYTDTANVDLLLNRSLFAMPAGDVSATVRASGSLLRLESSQNRDLIVTSRRLGRDSGGGSLSLDIPILPASAPFGRLSANANVAVEHLSDAGALRTFGAGLFWTPMRGMTLTASYRDQETAPTPAQLGDPVVFTQFVPVFDNIRGESVLATTITGGSAGLDDARAKNIRLGVNFNVLQEPNIRLSLDYNRNRASGAIMGFPGVTAETAAAYPGRFTRDGTGRLTQIDLRPINITGQKRDSLRWGINFSKRLKTPQSQIDAMRASFQRRFPDGRPSGGPGGEGGRRGDRGQAESVPPVEQGAGGGLPVPGPGPQEGMSGPQGGFGGARPGEGGAGTGGPGGGSPRGGAGGRGFGGFGGGGGGGGGGRINFALYHEWAFTNTTQLASTLPVLNLLDGDSIGGGAGPSRHQVELQAGISQSGFGLRLNGNWNSATRVTGIVGTPSSQLRFDDLATLNLRIFANLTQRPKLVEAVPFLRGSRVQIGVDNIFNARQRVTDGNGLVPFAYQPAFMDPVGRVVRVSFRKLLF